MVVLATKLYVDGDAQDRALDSLRSLVGNEITDLDVEYEVGLRHDDFPTVTIDGDDAVVARNVLREEFGEIVTDLEDGEVYTGTLISWDEDGFVLDAAEASVASAKIQNVRGSRRRVASSRSRKCSGMAPASAPAPVVSPAFVKTNAFPALARANATDWSITASPDSSSCCCSASRRVGMSISVAMNAVTPVSAETRSQIVRSVASIASGSPAPARGASGSDGSGYSSPAARCAHVR